ncbi:MAG: hypothetical protein LBD14_07060 [Puniceicoccales bacterium]|jgi:HEAT repeat protein|nr:hypothetical protein [Puniceicoccales bacterium]
MPALFLSRLKSSALLCLAVAASGTAAGNPDTAPQRFQLAVPPTATPGSADVFSRDFALRNLAYEARSREVLAALEKEQVAGVLRSVMDSLVSAGAGNGPDAASVAAFVQRQCRAGDETTATLAFSLLPALRVHDTAVYREGLARESASVRAAALNAAVKAGVGAAFLSEIELWATAREAVLRQAAADALIALAQRGAGGTLGKSPEAVASALMGKDPALAKPVLGAMLRNGISPGAALTAQLCALPEEAQVSAIGTFSDFPDRLDSAFLRQAALGENNRIAAAAAALLASKASRKNDVTLDCLARVIERGEPGRTAALINNLATDFEFSLLAIRLRHMPVGTHALNHDRFGEIGAVPASILGEARPLPNETALVWGRHIPREQTPSFSSIFRFFGALESVRTMAMSDAVKNRAAQLLMKESGSPQLPDIIHRMLASRHPVAVQLAAQIVLGIYDDPRLLETILVAHLSGSTVNAENLALLAPFLMRVSAEYSRVLASTARNFLAQSINPSRRALCLVLLGAHGIPEDAGKHLLPALRDPEATVRRAAARALAQVAPEVFSLHMDALAADSDATVRATVPLAFSKIGTRWEHRIDAALRLPQWTPPAVHFTLRKEHLPCLRRLEQDSDATVREHARLALFQHGKLDDPAPKLLAASTPVNNPNYTLRLVQSIRAAREGGHAIPPSLASLAPAREGSAAPGEKTLVFFVAPDATAHRAALDAAIDAVRALRPDIRIVIYYNDGSAGANAAKAVLCARFPVPMRHKNLPVLVFSSGAWHAFDTLPDFARLCEIAEYTRFDATFNIEQALGLPPPPNSLENTAGNDPFPFERTILLGGLGAILLICLRALYRYFLRRRYYNAV